MTPRGGKELFVMKKWAWVLIAVAVVAAVVVGVLLFGGGSQGAAGVYFLNFKPEIATVYERVAADYQKETGVSVRVVTAASGTYETTLMSELAKRDAPTIFQVNGPVGLKTWRDYCADLSGSGFYGLLSDSTLALTDNGRVLAVPYAVEGYGIIVNEEIMRRYFALPNQNSGMSATEDIDSYQKLRMVVEDMTANKQELGIEGVFASTSMAAGNQWRWQTHLLNMPLYYEFRETAGEGGDATLAGLEADTIRFTYNENFRALWDLYLNNSTTDPALLSSKTVDDSMAEFALGRCAMVQNGNWAASQLADVSGNTATELRFLPLYIGVEGEEGQGICIGTENYLCVNSRADAEAQSASLDFLEWLFSSETGMRYVREELGFISPFTSLSGGEPPADPLSAQVLEWTAREGVTSVPWIFASFPSERFKDDVGDALLEYAQGTMPWSEVVTATVDSWERER